MVTFRAATASATLLFGLVLSEPLSRAAVPDYKLGDVAAEDVVTPVALQVIDPEATEALQQKIAQDVLFVVRFAPQAVTDAEAELRKQVVTARSFFLATFREVLKGRAPSAADLDTPEYQATVKVVAAESPKYLPFDLLAPVWVRGGSDEGPMEALLQPLREIMSQPVVATKTDNPLPSNQTIRLLTVRSLGQAPTPRELDAAVVRMPVGRINSLWRARRLVETSFPSGKENLGRFVAGFVQPNALPDPALTEVLRAKRREGVTANETYPAAQTIVRKGQTIDRKALSALAAMREKSLIGTLQTKLEQEQTVAGQIKQQTLWIAAALGGVLLVLAIILWRLRARPSTALVTLGQSPALGGFDGTALQSGEARDEAWRERALLAEGKAERAHQAIRSGVLGWMREKVFQTAFRQRAELLSVQQRAEAEMSELERRLEELHTPLQDRIRAYERRIEELERDLAAKGEENRELIGARISVTRQQLNVERERSRFGAN